jgi:hypothetical protein
MTLSKRLHLARRFHPGLKPAIPPTPRLTPYRSHGRPRSASGAAVWRSRVDLLASLRRMPPD